jgi:7,8-dihydropterin-6-yl-methyl-4-(beta-D-ribofuranosyl)aminobenzene 5'-phosphate synthase
MRGVTLVPAAAGMVAAGLASATLVKFYRGRMEAERQWSGAAVSRVDDPDAVDSLSVLPLIDWRTADDTLAGEPGVSYLVKAGDLTVLFDVGFNAQRVSPSPLVRNMAALGVSRDAVDCVFISHPHADHTGGVKAARAKTFQLTPDDPEPFPVAAYVPAEMSHGSARVKVVTGPLQIAPGVFSIGPIPRSLWLLGLTQEQALAVNVAGKGIVLIIGCGHQTLERALSRTEALFDVPIHGVIGGLHFPVTESRMAHGVQKVIGTGKPPWRRVGPEDVHEAIRSLERRRPELVGISAHDSCDWALGEFADAFGGRYREVVVGHEIVV